MSSPRADRPAILYIAGAGRSGSTILEKVLGNSPGFVSVGEARWFWQHMVSGDRLCGCGERLAECPFWSDVTQRLHLAQEDIGRMARVSSDLDRTRNALFLAAGLPASRQFPQGFVESTACLYRGIRSLVGNSMIVDSSKVPSYLSLLLRVPELEVRVLHLVRDPRAYVYAQTRRRKPAPRAGGGSAQLRKHAGGPAVLAWVIENTLSGYWGRNAAAYTLMRYEAFAADPDAALERAFRELDIPREDWRQVKGARLLLEPTHSVDGNPTRFNRGPVMIAEDQAWRTDMPTSTSSLLGLVLWPWLSHYGYSK